MPPNEPTPLRWPPAEPPPHAAPSEPGSGCDGSGIAPAEGYEGLSRASVFLVCRPQSGGWVTARRGGGRRGERLSSMTRGRRQDQGMGGIFSEVRVGAARLVRGAVFGRWGGRGRDYL